MKNFFYSNTLLIILAVLLMTVFFLPDFIGTIPALIIGTIVIGISLFVYNKWSQLPNDTAVDDDPGQEESEK